MPHIRKKYDDVGKAVFEDQNAWVALSEVLINMLQDPGLKDAILIIDALDECSQGLHQILDFIVRSLSLSAQVKILVSSRNELDIQKRLEDAECTSSVSLELNSTSVVAAISSYIQYKVWDLRLDDDVQAEVEQYLTKHANGTFLWVALACDNLKRVPSFQVRSALASFPPGLDHVYERMLEKIFGPNASDLGRRILATVLVVHRPLTILELNSLVGFIPEGIGENEQTLYAISEQVMGLCGSFLVVQDETVYFVHQSAKDFLINKADDIFHLGNVHLQIFSASLSKMNMTLKKDIYGLVEPGYSIYEIPTMNPDPLGAVRYSCVYWIDHFLSSFPKDSFGIESNDSYYTPIQDFFQAKYLYWLEALVLLRNIPQGVIKMQKLEKQAKKAELAAPIIDLINDACRFIQEFAEAIHEAPLQTYVSALLFSPQSSLIRQLFEKDMPKWVIVGPKLEPNWRPRMLEGHRGPINSIAISGKGDRLASTSWDNTIKIWDTDSGIFVCTIFCDDGCDGAVFSPLDSNELASYSRISITLWNLSTNGNQKKLLPQCNSRIGSIAFSPRRQNILALCTNAGVELWNTATCELIWMRTAWCAMNLVFSTDNDLLAWYSRNAMQILDLTTGEIIHRRESTNIKGIVFSSNCNFVVLETCGYIDLWDSMMNRMILRLQHDEKDGVNNLCFSADSSLLAASIKTDIWIWDTSSGKLVQKITVEMFRRMAFSADNEQLFVGSHSGHIIVLDIDGASHIVDTELKIHKFYAWSKFSP
ncbi:hypothetical protein TrVGV298_007802 [Trichoderma virens]|nr:hypothetical protein TrVGV298_007802 [Trichoderma virens]